MSDLQPANANATASAETVIPALAAPFALKFSTLNNNSMSFRRTGGLPRGAKPVNQLPRRCNLGRRRPLEGFPDMFKRIFGSERAAKERISEGVYDRIVAAARQPALYADWNVPDTPLGRYEMMSLHLFLVLHRLRGEAGARELAQDLTDRFFAELDHSIRDLGVGNLSVPKRMKKLARMFYGRVASYGEAIDRGDAELLAAALARNVRPG